MNCGDSLCLVFFLGGSNVVTGVASPLVISYSIGWVRCFLTRWSTSDWRAWYVDMIIPSTCLILSGVGQDG